MNDETKLVKATRDINTGFQVKCFFDVLFYFIFKTGPYYKKDLKCK
jgi:hypothetical protein